MDKQNRKAIIAGNWKMNKTATEAKALISELIPAVKDAGCEVVICVPFTDLVTAVEMTKGTNIHVGAENVHFEKSGAFTGEISADMLTDLGVEYVVIGHSERRQYFAETNETVNKRTKAALAGGLKPIICVGESLDQREQGVTEELVRMQVKIALNGVTADELKNVVIAYEPIWAIGTGKTATADQAEEVCAAIRKVVGELYGEDAAKALTVQYGGSMNPKNAEELLSKPDVDGGLIGGASLKPADFVAAEAGKRLMTDAEGEKLAGVSEGATKTAASSTNGNVNIDGKEVVVYTEPENVLHDEDVEDFSAEEIAALLADAD